MNTGFSIAGFHGLTRTSAGDRTLLSYHPRSSSTWHWSIVLSKAGGTPHRAKNRTGQWHDYYWLPFGYRLIVSQQDWHKR